jgi:hypothetical protein
MTDFMLTDIKSYLSPGDLFLTYWLDRHLIVGIGDNQSIYSFDFVPWEDAEFLVNEFGLHVSRPELYATFVREEFRRSSWTARPSTGFSILQIIDQLGEKLITSAARDLISSGAYRRLIVFPDGLLHSLPIHLLVEYVLSTNWQDLFPGGIVYCPSASSYVYVKQKYRGRTFEKALVLIGDMKDNDLVEEAEYISNILPLKTDIVSSMASFINQAESADIIYVATHGHSARAEEENQSRKSLAHGEWLLDFDGGVITPNDFFSERIRLKKGSIVVLSACNVGHILPGPVHELEGFVQALFYAGAASVLAARWPVFYRSAQVIFPKALERFICGEESLAVAYSQAITQAMNDQELRSMMSGPEASTFFWGPFTLFGCGD